MIMHHNQAQAFISTNTILSICCSVLEIYLLLQMHLLKLYIDGVGILFIPNKECLCERCLSCHIINFKRFYCYVLKGVVRSPNTNGQLVYFPQTLQAVESIYLPVNIIKLIEIFIGFLCCTKKNVKLTKYVGKIFVLDSMFRILWMVTLLFIMRSNALYTPNFKNCLIMSISN